MKKKMLITSATDGIGFTAPHADALDDQNVRKLLRL